MITLTESALSSAQWTALQSLVSDAAFELTLYAWNPVFDTALSGSVSRNDFDSAVYGGTIWRYSGLGINDLSSSSIGGYSDPTGVSFDSPPSLLTDTDLYATVLTDTGISQNVYSGSWSGWTEIVTDSTVVFVSATASDTVHYVTYDGTNYQFHVWNGAVVDSDIYWGFPMTSFSARRINGKDILAFTANTPGTPSAKTENLQVVKYILPTGGVQVITYQYGTWSDHIEVDRVDQWSAFRYRSNLKLSVIDSTLWMTCYSSEGTAKQPVTGTRIYSSKDGVHWSRGELVTLAVSGQWGVSLQRLGSTVYALGRGGGSSADSTLLFGVAASGTVMRLTPYVHQLTVNRKDMQQLSTVIDNRDAWLSDTLLGQDRTFSLLLQTGFWIPVTGYVYQQQGIFEVDSVEPVTDQPQQLVQLTARDHLAWMTTKTQSEQFVNWLPQGLGLDAYIDTTGTGYGGMTHSAPADGTWTAHDNYLNLTSNNTSGLVYSTYLFDAWNGSVQSHFGLASASNHEYAGLIFRSQDKDNGYAYYFDQTSAKLRLERWSGGVRTLLWESSVKSWGTVAAQYLRADFRYSHITLFSSSASPAVNANIIWTIEHEIVVDGFTNAATADSGYVGMVGQGFSDLDTWNDQPDPIGSGDLPPWWDPYVPPTPSPFPPDTGTVPTRAILFDYGGTGCYTASGYNPVVGPSTGDWVTRSTGLTGTTIWATGDPWDWRRYFSLQTTGLFRNDNPFAGGTWSLVASTTTLLGNPSRVAGQVMMSINRRGYIGIATQHHGWAYSFDYGSTWSQSSILGGSIDWSHSYGGFHVHAAMDPYGSGHIYASVAGDADFSNRVFESHDWGVSWTLVKLFSGDLGVPNTSDALDVPYIREDGVTHNIDDGSQLLYINSGGGIYRSRDGGASWTAFGLGLDVVVGWNIRSYTWNGGTVISMFKDGSHQFFAFITDLDTFVSSATPGTGNTVFDYGGVFNIFYNYVNGYSGNSQAALFWSAEGDPAYFTLDGGTTVVAINKPSGVVSIAYMEWNLDN